MIIGTKEKPVRFSFVHVFEPKENPQSGKSEYSVQIVIDKKNTQVINSIEKAINDAIEQGIASKKFSRALTNSRDFWKCLRDGDESAAEKDDGSRDYLKGCVFMNAKSSDKFPPNVVDRFGQPILRPNEFYSGCYGLAAVQFFSYGKGKGGISASLQNIMKREDGDRLDGRVSAESAFKEFVDEDSSTDLL